MPSIIAYTYEADVHCPGCTREDLNRAKIYLPYVTMGVSHDEHGIPDGPAPIDREGNPVHPVFSTDEHDFTHCGDCHGEIG